MDFGLLGPLLVRDGGRPVVVSAPRQRVLLATLLLSAGRVVSADALAETLWDGRPPAGARGALHSGVQRLRAKLDPAGSGLIVTRAPGYVLQLGEGEFDVRRFGVLAARGEAAAAAGEWAQAAGLWREALALWRGEALADVPSQLLREREVPALEDARLQVVGARIGADLRLGRHDEVVAELRQLVAAWPLREHFHAQLMLALYRGGRQGEALAAYQDARRMLTAELGVDPGPELQGLHQQILAADAGLMLPMGGQPPGAAAAMSTPVQGEQGAADASSSAGPDGRTAGPGPGAGPGQGAGPSQGAGPGWRSGPAGPEPVVPRQLPTAARHFAGRAGALKILASLVGEAAGTDRAGGTDGTGGAGGTGGTGRADGAGGAGGTGGAGGVGQAVVISAIEGTAGIGKTTLAVHFAHQVADRFPDGQLYVNLRGFDPAGAPMTSGEAIRIFLDALGVQAARIPASLDGQVGLYRSLLAGRRVLLLLDNAHDVDQVRPLLPASPGCLVIVTSRSQLTSLVAAEGAYPLTLEVLTGDEARELLAARLGPQRLAAEPVAADELAELCARLPLALAIAAARAASRPGLSLASLAADLRDTGGRLDALDAGHAAANVRAVFSWSYQQLDPAAARMFRLLGLHPGPDASAAVAASMAAVPLREGRRLLAELARAHLLAEPVPGRFAFHDLLRAYAAERAQADESEAERRAATGRMLDHYLHTAHPAAMLAHHTSRDLITLAAPLPGVEPERMEDAGQALAWFDAEHQVLMAAAAQALETGFDVHAWQIPWALGRFLELRGPWHDWVAAGQIALAATQRLGDRTAQAFAHRRLGFTCGRLGDYEAAHAQLEQALSIYTELGDLPGQADVNQVLAAILDDEGREREALGHAQRALELFTATGDRGGQAMALNAVGWLHAKLGDPRQALVYCGQAIDLLEELARHSQTAAGTWDSLGYAHQQLGNHAESAACYQRALDLLREIGDRRGQADTLVHIGDAQLAAGHPGEARAAWEEALTILDDLHDPYAAQIRTKLAGPAT